jgi:hypothetical protein
MARVNARTALAALEVWLLTVVAHSLAGGAIPSATWLLVVGGMVLLATGVVMRRRVPVWVAAAAVGLAQLCLHVTLTAAAPPVPGAMTMAGHDRAGHAMPMPSADPTLLDGLTGLSTQMVVAHVLTALVTGFVWWLRRRAVEVVLRLTAPVAAVVRLRAPRLLVRPRPRPHARPWLLGDPGRAPPTALVAA